jgi:hypothetical protein
MNKPTARYIIVLDRYDPGDDYAASEVGEGGHDGSADAACEQVANELQEAMNQAGVPAGFFNVIDRLKIESTETVSGASAAQVAMQLGWTRRMDSDE